MARVQDVGLMEPTPVGSDVGKVRRCSGLALPPRSLGDRTNVQFGGDDYQSSTQVHEILFVVTEHLSFLAPVPLCPQHQASGAIKSDLSNAVVRWIRPLLHLDSMILNVEFHGVSNRAWNGALEERRVAIFVVVAELLDSEIFPTLDENNELDHWFSNRSLTACEP